MFLNGPLFYLLAVALWIEVGGLLLHGLYDFMKKPLPSLPGRVAVVFFWPILIMVGYVWATIDELTKKGG